MGNWLHGWVTCASCGYRWMAVFPEGATYLQCGRCLFGRAHAGQREPARASEGA